MVESFFTAGARRVFLDFERGKDRRPTKMYIEMKSTRGPERAPLFLLHQTYRRMNRTEANPQPVKDHGQRFLVLELKQ